MGSGSLIWGIPAYYSLATRLNSLGYGTRLGRPFTKGSVEVILTNRFYEGKVVYHPGKPDEEVREGAHEVPDEVRELWLKCREIRQDRSQSRHVLITREHRFYPLTVPLKCDNCGRLYHGKVARRKGGATVLKMGHDSRRCGTRPTMVPTSKLHARFSDDVLSRLVLDDGWKRTIFKDMDTSRPVEEIEAGKEIEEDLARLRKLSLWQDMSEDEYAGQRGELERELKMLESPRTPVSLPDLDAAARLLNDLPALWQHPGTTDQQRQEFTREVFVEIRIDGRDIVAVRPKKQYLPLFAYALWSRGVNGVSRTPVTPTSLIPGTDRIR